MQQKMNRKLFVILLILGSSLVLFSQNKFEISVLSDFDSAKNPLVQSNVVITNLQEDKAIVIEEIEFINQLPKFGRHYSKFVNQKKQVDYCHSCKCSPELNYRRFTYLLLPNQTIYLDRFLRIESKLECKIKWREIDVKDLENSVCAKNPIPPKMKIPPHIFNYYKERLLSRSNSETTMSSGASQGNPGNPKTTRHSNGPQGNPGSAGTNRINCWDLNGNGVGDDFEDTNGDGSFTAADCQGPQGRPQGNPPNPDRVGPQGQLGPGSRNTKLSLEEQVIEYIRGQPGPGSPRGLPSLNSLMFFYRNLNDSLQNYYQDIGFGNEIVIIKGFENFQAFVDTIELELDEQSNISNCGLDKNIFNEDYQRFLDRFSCSESISNHKLKDLKCFQLNEDILIAYNRDTNFVYLKRNNELIPIVQPQITIDAIDCMQLMKEKRKQIGRENGIYCHLSPNYFGDIVEFVKRKYRGKSPGICENKLSTDEFVEVLKRAKECNLTLSAKKRNRRDLPYYLLFE